MEIDQRLLSARAGHHRTPQGSSSGHLETRVSATEVVNSCQRWAQFRVKTSEYPFLRSLSLLFVLGGQWFCSSETDFWQVFDLKHAQAATSDLNEILQIDVGFSDMGCCRYISLDISSFGDGKSTC